MPTALDLRLTPALHVGSCSLPLRAQDPLPDTALWGTAGRWICSVITYSFSRRYRSPQAAE